MASTLLLQTPQPQPHLYLQPTSHHHNLPTPPTAPIEIFRSDLKNNNNNYAQSSTGTAKTKTKTKTTTFTIPQPSTITTTTKLQTMKNIIKKAIPPPSSTTSMSTSGSTNPRHLRPRSLSFHSPISTSSFSTHFRHSHQHGDNENYASSPTSSIDSSHEEEFVDTFEEDEDEEALIFEDEIEMGMQGGRSRRFGGLGGDVLGNVPVGRKDSFVEKMERLERARRLLESYGGRC